MKKNAGHNLFFAYSWWEQWEESYGCVIKSMSRSHFTTNFAILGSCSWQVLWDSPLYIPIQDSLNFTLFHSCFRLLHLQTFRCSPSAQQVCLHWAQKTHWHTRTGLMIDHGGKHWPSLDTLHSTSQKTHIYLQPCYFFQIKLELFLHKTFQGGASVGHSLCLLVKLFFCLFPTTEPYNVNSAAPASHRKINTNVFAVIN